MMEEGKPNHLELNREQIPCDQLSAIECNAAVTQDTTCVMPKPVIVVMQINSHNV